MIARRLLGALALILFAVAVALVVLWIWTGDGRYGWTSAVAIVTAFVPFGLAVAPGSDS